MRLIYFFVLFLSSTNLLGQSSNYFFLDWNVVDGVPVVNSSDSYLLEFNQTFDSYTTDFEIEVKETVFVDCNASEISFLENQNLGSKVRLAHNFGVERKQLRIKGSIFPFVFREGKFKKLVFCELSVTFNSLPEAKSSLASAENSVLSTGDWFKISVTENGIHKLTYQNLIDLGVNVQSINPNNIKLYGRPGGMLPVLNSEPRIDDLEELSIQVYGQDDGSFDENDYLIFYAQSPNQWQENSGKFSRQMHLFDDKTYYFLTTDLGVGKRISNQSSESSFDTVITTFNDYQIHENDEVNFVKSGKSWYGDVFDIVNNRTFNFNFPNRIGESKLKLVLAARASSPFNSTFTINSPGMTEEVSNISGVYGSYNYANINTIEKEVNPNSDNIQVQLIFSSTSSSGKGWIDYIEVNAERELKMNASQMPFRSLASVRPESVSQFEISNASSSLTIWDVSNPLSPKNQSLSTGDSKAIFSLKTDSLKEFIAFTGGFKNVELNGKVSNQNLHAIRDIDYLIVSHPTFWTEANRLADFHRTKGLSVAVVTPQQIYNEFSSGSQDVSAIRDFARMLYNNDNPLKYMLLFGDASYDPKNRVNENTNFVVSYQSSNSTNALYSYVSDDYFALLDEGESISNDNPLLSFLDIGVGRFPVQTLEEAKNAVDKVINYNVEDSFGDWRLRLCFVGDDNDEVETVHTAQAEQLADYIAAEHPNMNVDKIYLDAYEQETSTGGQRCPTANTAISNAVNQGMFLVNYTGHGGELGWAHERILGIEDINTWNNENNLPLFMTATCEFGRYDDPERVSAAEHIFLKEKSGAIALLTTSRVVFTDNNLDLNEAFLENLFPNSNVATFPRLGDILMRTKNNVNDIEDSNHRNFTLLGDPALTLAYPVYDVVLTEVVDSAKALGQVTVKGEVQRNGEKLETFEGFVFPTVFDKRTDFQTLGQDESPVLVFDLQKNKLFNGKSTVSQGEFSFTFIVPKDINYDYGNGKISLYAKGTVNEEQLDASGFSNDIVIGGTAEGFSNDNLGPEISLFINDTNFIRGGITNADPNLYALLYDENGINTVGNGIGHDMTAVLNQESSNPIVLNDFYEYDIDSYQSGVIEYPFSSLEEGMHTLTVKVWDVFNNSSESTTEFRVISADNLSIQNLINYPNPVIDFTSFYFEHNQSDLDMKVNLVIMDISGKVVKIIEDNIKPVGFRYGPINWDGKSNEGDKLKSGMYIYNIVAKASDGEVSTKSGRLILID